MSKAILQLITLSLMMYGTHQFWENCVDPMLDKIFVKESKNEEA